MGYSTISLPPTYNEQGTPPQYEEEGIPPAYSEVDEAEHVSRLQG